MSADEERIALFLDYENLAIGARENLGGMVFDFKPVADALAERGRVVTRRAYADWLKFGEDGRMLTRFHVELIEIPQRMGSVRKNAADIKMAVDAVELCLERDYITTFVLGTGDSDFTPLVHKLREHNKQVIGLGVQMSTSALLPPACDEFLFYERLEGVEVPKRRIIVPRGSGGRRRRPQVGDVGELGEISETTEAADAETTVVEAGAEAPATIEQLERLVTQTLAGLERTSGAVRASSLKRAILRKESTFNEADHGFRGFTELLRSLAERGVIELAESSSPGDPDVQFPSDGNLGEVGHAFELLAATVERLAPEGSNGTPLSGLKTQLRRAQSEFSEKRFGFGGFLQFAKAAVARGIVAMEWNDDADDYLLTPVPGRPRLEPAPAAPTTGPAAVTDTATATETGVSASGTEPTARAATATAPDATATGASGRSELASAGDGDATVDPGLAARPRRGRGGRGRGRGGRGEDETGVTGSPADDATAEATPAASTVTTAVPGAAGTGEATGPGAAAGNEPSDSDEAAGTATTAGPVATAGPGAGPLLPEPAAADGATPATVLEAAPSEPLGEAATPTDATADDTTAEAPKRRRRAPARKAGAEGEGTAGATTDPAATTVDAGVPAAEASGDAESAAAPVKKPAARRRRTTKADEAAAPSPTAES